MPVLYPAFAKTSGMVASPGRRNVRPAVTDVAPLRSAASPVSNWPRVGLHMGATWKSVRRIDCFAKVSRFGVFRTVLPVYEKSPSPWSSVMTMRTLGLLGVSATAAEGNTTVAITQDRNRSMTEISGELRGQGSGLLLGRPGTVGAEALPPVRAFLLDVGVQFLERLFHPVKALFFLLL